MKKYEVQIRKNGRWETILTSTRRDVACDVAKQHGGQVITWTGAIDYNFTDSSIKGRCLGCQTVVSILEKGQKCQCGGTLQVIQGMHRAKSAGWIS